MSTVWTVDREYESADWHCETIAICASQEVAEQIAEQAARVRDTTWRTDERGRRVLAGNYETYVVEECEVRTA